MRASLAAVESGNVEAGFVYKTDALISNKVKVACEIPANAGPAIRYPVAVLTTSKELAAAQPYQREQDEPPRASERMATG